MFFELTGLRPPVLYAMDDVPLAEVVTYLTGNPKLLPTLVLLGSFLVPVTFVAWAFERRDSGELTADLVFRTFLVGRCTR